MSFWGATVITNLLRAIPYVGIDITQWIWGGFAINNATLTRFYSLHFILPFILLALVIIHLILLHEKGSRNPLGLPLNLDKINFHPFYTLKDLLGLCFFLLFFLLIILQLPYVFFDPDNFIPANPIVTPPHIQPEWYFLFAYAILRSIPNKLGGVIALFLSILILATLPFTIKNNLKLPNAYLSHKTIFWILTAVFFILTFLGSCPIEFPFVNLSLIFTILYFFIFIIIPLLSI